MKTVTSFAAAALAAAVGFAASPPTTTGTPVQIVVTAVPPSTGARPAALEGGELSIVENKTPVPVVNLQRLAGDLSDVQLFVFLDDSTRSSSLGTHFAELKQFIAALPPSAQVALGYMRNGTFALAQPLTTDHQKTAASLRLPVALPGANGSPYFALSELMARWPSKQPATRRAVLMLTDGVDRYYDTSIVDDPFVDSAVHSAVKRGVLVYSIYLRGTGRFGRGEWSTNVAQSRLIQVSEQTGGHAYFEAFSDPVAIAPFLNDFETRLANQYQVTIRALDERGYQPIKIRTEIPGLKVEGPTQIYVP
jgi:hypothetical protein